WARLISPGRVRSPPPTRAGSEAEWCGSRNGRSRKRPPPRSPPATDWIIPSSKASAGSSGGRMPGSRAASIDFPEPGGPTIRRLWPPDAAISSARLALSWPLTSCRSSPAARDGASFAAGGGNSWVPLKWLTIARRLGAAMISTSPAQAASPPHSSGQMIPLARLGDRLIWQADDGERRQPRGDRHLGLDIDDLDPVKRHGAHPRDHLPGLSPLSRGSLGRCGVER